MQKIHYKYIPFRISKVDIFIHSILFICLSVLPLFPNYTWISTMILLPLTAISLFIKDGSFKLYTDLFLKRTFIVFLFAVLSVIFIQYFSAYLEEIKKFLGIIVIFIIGVFLLRKNINNIWILYIILFSKFVIMVYYTYKAGVISNFNPDSGRLQSGAEVGINANAYGYFAFIALYALAAIININKHFLYKFLFIVVFVISMYINILAASRAGLLFTILAATAGIISTTFKTWKGLFIKSVLIVLLLIFLLGKEFSVLNNLVIFQRYMTFAETGQDERLIILKNGIKLFTENPMGIGAGQFPLAMAETNLGKIAASHNSFLLVAANYGVIALGVFLSMFYLFIKNSLIVIGRKPLFLKKYGILFLSFGVLFFAYNFFYDMVLNLYIMFMFFLVNYHQNSLIKGIIPSINKK